MVKEENNKNYAYIAIVAIVAIVSVFVMFAGSGSKQTSQPVFTGNLVGDLVGDARTRISSSSNQRCIDTDGGIVPEVFGVVQYGNERYADECINSNELIEYYCDGDRPSRTIIRCPRNSVCLNGACVEETPEDQWCNPEWGIVIPEVDPNLCWQKEISTNIRNHADSLNYCNNDVTLGNLNWDMPTRTEMVKLRNYACNNKEEGNECSWPCDPYSESYCGSVSGPRLHDYLNNQKEFTGFLNEWYWTSNLFSSNPSNAWNVRFNSAAVGASAVANNFRVVCVSRNSEEVHGCTDPEAINYNPDATIDDGSCEYASDNWCNPEWGIVIPEVDPNLCWQKEVSPILRNYSDSLSYCNNEVTLGDLDWDMPARAEMVKLRNYACDNKEGGNDCSWPCDPYNQVGCAYVHEANLHDYLNDHEGFIGFPTGVRTNTLWFQYPSSAWNVYFNSGFVSTVNIVGNSWVVCVSRDSEVIYGCTDPGAINYNPDATVDDGGCDYFQCGQTIYEDTVFTHDLECAGVGLIIGADNITLDCNGHSITRIGNNHHYTGVRLANINGATVKNCVISNFLTNIRLSNSSNNNIINNSLFDSHSTSLFLIWNSTDNLIEHNHVEGSNFFGIAMYSDGDDYNTIINNVVLNNHAGININSNYNYVSDNVVCDNFNPVTGGGYTDIQQQGSHVGNNGKDNTCDNPNNWNDQGTTGCTYACVEEDPEEVLQCGQIIYEDTIMTHDLLDCPGNGLRIGASGITLDCANHKIKGTPQSSHGIGFWFSQLDVLYNITIKNCDVSEFQFGLIKNIPNKLINGLVLYNNTFQNMLYDGVRLTSMEGVEVIGNKFLYNNNNGLLMNYQADHINLIDNIACGNNVKDIGGVPIYTYTGSENTCDLVFIYNDYNTTGCTYACN